MPKFHRDTSRGWFGGVCAGLADSLGLDVRVVRAIAVLVAFTGLGIWLYTIAWLVVPNQAGHAIIPLGSGSA
jgi:phage shock protein PspC (stress-responsive transcriptional regulator)